MIRSSPTGVLRGRNRSRIRRTRPRVTYYGYRYYDPVTGRFSGVSPRSETNTPSYMGKCASAGTDPRESDPRESFAFGCCQSKGGNRGFPRGKGWLPVKKSNSEEQSLLTHVSKKIRFACGFSRSPSSQNPVFQNGSGKRTGP